MASNCTTESRETDSITSDKTDTLSRKYMHSQIFVRVRVRARKRGKKDQEEGASKAGGKNVSRT
jgi:hypothetical protein